MRLNGDRRCWPSASEQPFSTGGQPCQIGKAQGIEKPCGFFDAKGKGLREPEILTDFRGGALTEGIVTSASVRYLRK